MDMPTTNLKWMFLLCIAALMLGGSALILINEIQQVLATHEYILADVPMEVHKNGENILRLCIYFDVDCES